MWKLIITDDQGEHTTVNLVREEYRMGRGDENPIRLTERNISRRHAVLRRTSGGFSITDAGSMCGTFVNGVRVHREQPLGHRDLVQLGDYRIEVVDEALDTQEQGHGPMPDATTVPPARLPHRLVVLIGPTQGAEYALESDRLLIGRDDDCDVKIDHGSVSRIHAEVRRLGEDHFEVIDKGSANGLRINGHERQRAVLDGRDVVELGDVVLKYIPKGQIFRVDAAEGERIAAMSGAAMTARPDSRLPLGAPLLAALVGAAVVGGLVLLFFVRGGSPLAGKDQDGGPQGPLSSALELHRQGDVFGAHDQVLRLATSEPIAARPELLEIESAWASAMMRAALAENNPERKRELLAEVSAAGTVPEAERRQAARALADLDNKPADEHGSQDAEGADAATGAPSPVDNAEDVGSLPEEVPGEEAP
jgi:ABC transport system ATP-binding/permease protein